MQNIYFKLLKGIPPLVNLKESN